MTLRGLEERSGDVRGDNPVGVTRPRLAVQAQDRRSSRSAIRARTHGAGISVS